MNGTSTSGAKPKHAGQSEQLSNPGVSADPNSANQTGTGQPLSSSTSFLSHMFSFDASVKPAPSQSEASTASIGPSQAAVWFNALKSLQLSSLFEGLAFTPNFKCFALLAGFAGWLLVLNWVKEHDHGPNQMVSHPTTNLGVATASDRALVVGVKSAYPFGTTAAAVPLVEQPIRIATGPGQAMSANHTGDERFGSPADYFSAAAPTGVHAQEPILPPQTAQPMRFARANEFNQPPAYNIQLNSASGTLLKTIVNR